MQIERIKLTRKVFTIL